MTRSPTKKHTRKASQLSVKTQDQISLKINRFMTQQGWVRPPCVQLGSSRDGEPIAPDLPRS